MTALRHIAVLLALAQPALAQRETLVGLRAPLRALPAAAAVAAAAAPDTLSLPFFDDFAAPTAGAPDGRKWADRHVFINHTYAVNAPTMGVATFDILDETGRLYPHAGPAPFVADVLTSKPIRLSPDDAGVFLSFAYQPQGHGDMPDSRDSLSVQFFSPDDSAWVHVWAASPDTMDGALFPNVLHERTYLDGGHRQVRSDSLSRRFFKVMLPVGEGFLRPGFRFRFTGYATRQKEEVPGREGSCDMWHVDVVYLNKDRSAADTVMVDVAIQAPITRLLKDYAQMPWQHLRSSSLAQREQLLNEEGTVTVSSKIANLWNHPDGNTFNAAFTLTCVKGGDSPEPYLPKDGSYSIPASSTRPFDYYLPASSLLNTPRDDADSVDFDVRLVISSYYIDVPLSGEYRANDTCTFRQHFHSCYAYDDGTAENGYGVYGGLYGREKVAVKYKAYLRDTLSGVYLYFNHAADSGNLQPFTLAVWSDRGGLPAEELYTDAGCRVRFDSLHRFVHYPLARPVVVDAGATFYVGFQQQGTAMLNVGFDVNTPAAGKMFVSLNGYEWEPSKYDGQGALMVRPSFARRRDYAPLPTAAPPVPAERQLLLYPNPVRGALHVALPAALRGKTLRMEVFTLSGSKVLERHVSAGSTVSVAALPAGSYAVRFSESGGAASGGAKRGGVVGFARFVKL